ncbi:hypothetical protein SDJN03_22080, partial [Cucurbita argyrosperma subsp. sororia]
MNRASSTVSSSLPRPWLLDRLRQRLSLIRPRFGDEATFPHPRNLSSSISEASRSLTVPQIKSATFSLFNEYYVTCGRLRLADSGRRSLSVMTAR